jgi:hypothetical protein
MGNVVGLSEFNLAPLKKAIGFEAYSDPVTECALRLCLRFAEVEKKDRNVKDFRKNALVEIISKLQPICAIYNQFYEDQFTYNSNPKTELIRAAIILNLYRETLPEKKTKISNIDDAIIPFMEIVILLKQSNENFHKTGETSLKKEPHSLFMTHILWLEFLKNNKEPPKGPKNEYRQKFFKRKIHAIQNLCDEKLRIGTKIKTYIAQIIPKISDDPISLLLLPAPKKRNAFYRRPFEINHQQPEPLDDELNMSENILYLSELGPDSIRRYFNIAADDKSGSAAIAFLYKILGEELYNKRLSRLENARNIATALIEKIDYRLSLYRVHQKDFFSGIADINQNALLIDVICDEYTQTINKPIMLFKNGEYVFENLKDDGFEENVIGNACFFWEEALGIEFCGNDEYTEPESRFLAHINSLQRLQELRSNFSEHTPQDLNIIAQKEILPMLKFCSIYTKIGQELNDQATQIYNVIKKILAPPVVVTPRKPPVLRLIHKRSP